MLCYTCTLSHTIQCSNSSVLQLATTLLYKKINSSHSPPTTPCYSLPCSAFCCNPCTVSAAVQKRAQSIHTRCMMGQDKFLLQSFVCQLRLPDDNTLIFSSRTCMQIFLRHSVNHLQTTHMFSLTKQGLVLLCSFRWNLKAAKGDCKVKNRQCSSCQSLFQRKRVCQMNYLGRSPVQSLLYLSFYLLATSIILPLYRCHF